MLGDLGGALLEPCCTSRSKPERPIRTRLPMRTASRVPASIQLRIVWGNQPQRRRDLVNREVLVIEHERNATVPAVSRPSSLRPLRHIAEEPLVYDRERNEIHQARCPRATGEPLERGDELELIWAPRLCPACQPDTTLAL